MCSIIFRPGVEEILDARKYAIERLLALNEEALFFIEKVIFMTRNSVFLGKAKAVIIALFVSATLVLNFLVIPIALADNSDNLCQSLAADKRAEAQQLRQQAIDSRNDGDDETAVGLDEKAAKTDNDAAKLESAAGDCPINDPSEIGKVLGNDDDNNNGNNDNNNGNNDNNNGNNDNNNGNNTTRRARRQSAKVDSGISLTINSQNFSSNRIACVRILNFTTKQPITFKEFQALSQLAQTQGKTFQVQTQLISQSQSQVCNGQPTNQKVQPLATSLGTFSINTAGNPSQSFGKLIIQTDNQLVTMTGDPTLSKSNVVNPTSIKIPLRFSDTDPLLQVPTNGSRR
jgi:hypothetical protein